MKSSTAIAGRFPAYTLVATALRWIAPLANTFSTQGIAAALLATLCAAMSATAAGQTAYFSGSQGVFRTQQSGVQGVAVDGNGNIYISDSLSDTVVVDSIEPGGKAEISIGVALNRPQQIAVDKSGNVYIADLMNNRVLKETLSGGAYIQSTIGSNMSYVAGVAVDASGNVYVADQGHQTVWKETHSGSTYIQSMVAEGLGNPTGLAADSLGNVYIADAYYNLVLKETKVGNTYVQTTIGSGLNNPEGVALDASNNIYIADSGHNRVLKELQSGGTYTQSIVPTEGLNNPEQIAVDAVGDLYVADTLNGRIVKLSTAGGVIAPTAVGTASPAIDMFFTFIMAGSLSAPQVVTQGATGLDFVSSAGGTCNAGSTFSVNQTCVIKVKQAARVSGTRYGAALLRGSFGNVIATGYLMGTGTGPQVAFTPPTQTTIPYSTNGQSSPYGIAVDASGDVYIADSDNNRVLKETLLPGGFSESVVSFNVDSPTGVAVDGAGDVYIVDSGNNRVLKEVHLGAGYTESVLSSGLASPYGVAVDGSGDVFITDTMNKRVLKEKPLGSAYVQSTLPTAGFKGPFGIAIDGMGDIYLSDNDNVYKLTRSGATYVQSFFDGSFGNPFGLAVDGAGNVYISEFNNHDVIEDTLTPSGMVKTALPTGNLSAPYGVAVDGGGNVYIADVGYDQVFKVDIADPPALTFAKTNVGSLSSDSTRMVEVRNIGNEDLAFTIPSTGLNPSITPNFTLFSGSQGSCPLVKSSSAEPGLLEPGAACTLYLSFLPTIPGFLQGAVVLTDNNLNIPSTQSIALNGTGLEATASLSGTSLSFGPVAIGKSTLSQGVKLINTGNSALNIAGISVSGPNASSFVFTNNCGASLAVGAKCTIQGHFAPATVGIQTATITIIDNALNSPQSVALKGTGIQATPVITWPTPASITYGTALSATQLDATSTVAGTFAYTPALGIVLKAGPQTLSVTFTPSDTTDYQTAAATVTLPVTKAMLTVTANNLSKVYGAALPTLTDTIAGFVNGDTAATAVTGAAGLTTTATAASATGTYPITAAAGTLVSTKYSFQFVGGTLTVTKAMLTVTANNLSKVYGAALPTLTDTIAGFVNGDTAATAVTGAAGLTTTATAASATGTYPITAVAGTLVSTKYSFQFVGGSLTVTPIGVAATPTFTPAAGTYTSAQSVTIKHTTAASVIYYTTNGTTPTTSSTLYSGAIQVAATETVKAIAVATGYTNSAVATATYTIQ